MLYNMFILMQHVFFWLSFTVNLKLKISKMKKGTKVNVELSLSDALKLGIAKAISGTGEIISKYTNGVDGYFVKFGERIVGIASKYNAIAPTK